MEKVTLETLSELLGKMPPSEDNFREIQASQQAKERIPESKQIGESHISLNYTAQVMM